MIEYEFKHFHWSLLLSNHSWVSHLESELSKRNLPAEKKWSRRQSRRCRGGDPPDVARAWVGVGVLLAGGLHQHQVGAWTMLSPNLVVMVVVMVKMMTMVDWHWHQIVAWPNALAKPDWWWFFSGDKVLIEVVPPWCTQDRKIARWKGIGNGRKWNQRNLCISSTIWYQFHPLFDINFVHCFISKGKNEIGRNFSKIFRNLKEIEILSQSLYKDKSQN